MGKEQDKPPKDDSGSQDAFSIAMQGAEKPKANTEPAPPESSLPRPGVVHVSGAAPKGKGRTMGPSMSVQPPTLGLAVSGTIDRPFRASVEDGVAPVEPTLRSSVSTDVKPEEPEAIMPSRAEGATDIPLSPNKPRGVSSVATRSPGASRTSRRADAKTALREEMEALRAPGVAQAPGAVSVTGTGSSATATTSVASDANTKAALRAEAAALRQNKATGMGAVAFASTAAPTSGDPNNAKAALRAEVAALRQNNAAGMGTPGAVAVASAAAPTSGDTNDTKAAVRAEVQALRQQHGAANAPGMVAVAPNAANTSLDAKSVIREEMNQLKQENPDMLQPGAVKVVAGEPTDSHTTARAERASRKATRGSTSNRDINTKLSIAPGNSDGRPGATNSVSETVANKMVDEGVLEIPSAMASVDEEKGMKPSMLAVQASSTELSKASAKMGGSSKILEEEGMIAAQVIDEEELEKEFQEKIMKNAVAAEVVSEDELKGSSTGHCVRLACCLVVFVAIVVAIVVPLSKTDDPPTDPPTPSPTEQADYDYLFDLVEPYSGDALLNETTAQFRALNWLAFEDPAQLTIKQQNVSTLLERYAAAVFYYSTNGPFWTNQMNFLSNDTICLWNLASKGLQCHDGTQDVRRIAFTRNNLTGTLPPEMAAFEKLGTVNLLLDSLHGTLPPQLQSLATGFTFFQIAFQDITGTIPDVYRRLTDLETLNFYANKLTGTIPDEWFSKLASIKNLAFGQNQFNGTIPDFFRESFLTVLSLEENTFTGTMPDTMFLQKNLEWILVNDNLLTGPIPESIAGLDSLTVFHAHSNMFNSTIPTNIGVPRDMEEFFIRDNLVTGTIPYQMGELDRLIELDLSSNLLTGPLPYQMGQMNDLENLVISNNALTGTVPATFNRLYDLQEFELTNTSIVGGLDGTFCSGSFATEIAADCLGDTPEVSCECCTTCCNGGGEECNVNVYGVCETRSGTFELDPERGSTCTCSEDGTEQSCADECQSCSVDGSICVASTDYGYSFDPTSGDIVSFHSTLQYTAGRTETIEYSMNVDDDFCEVQVNGQKCTACSLSLCVNGAEGFVVECDNLDPPDRIDTCDFRDPTYLEVFYLTDLALQRGCPPMVLNLRPN